MTPNEQDTQLDQPVVVSERADLLAVSALVTGATALAIQVADSPTVQKIVDKVVSGDGKHRKE